MKTYAKQALFVLAVVAAAKFVKGMLPIPDSAKALLP
jgi:hypothetical protein